MFSNRAGCHKSYVYHLKLKEVTIRTKQYPIAQYVKEGIQEVGSMEYIIEQAESAHNNALHVIKKGDGSVRPILGFRKLSRYVIFPQNQAESIDNPQLFPGNLILVKSSYTSLIFKIEYQIDLKHILPSVLEAILSSSSEYPMAYLVPQLFSF